MAGMQVDRFMLDSKAADAVLDLRRAFDKVEHIAKWLTNNPAKPAADGGDPLISEFGYSEDDAYVVRVVFQNFDTVRVDNANNFDIASKLTGLD